MTTVARIVESMDLIKKRFPVALRRVWDGDELVRLTQGGSKDHDRPGGCDANVFDFFSGLRIIASREKHSSFGTCLHCSLSMTEQGAKAVGSMDNFCKLAGATLAEFRIDMSEAKQPAPCTNGVLHLIFSPEYTALVCGRHGVDDEAAQSKIG